MSLWRIKSTWHKAVNDAAIKSIAYFFGSCSGTKPLKKRLAAKAGVGAGSRAGEVVSVAF